MDKFIATRGSLRVANAAYVSVEGPPGFTRSGQQPWNIDGGVIGKTAKGPRASSGFKSYDWQVQAETDLGRWLYSFLLEGVCLQAVLELLRIIRQICRRSLTPQQRTVLVADVQDTLAFVRRHLPETEWSVLLHGLLHIAEQCVRWGPAWVRWMYGFERMNGHLVSLIQDKANPEASIAKVHMRLMFHRASAASSFRDSLAEGGVVDESELAAIDLVVPSRQKEPPTEELWRGGEPARIESSDRCPLTSLVTSILSL